MTDLDLVNNLNRSNKFLFLEGYGISVRLDDGKLIITDGNGDRRIFLPKRFPYSNVVVYGTTGSISFEAIRWLMKHDVQISVLNWNGKLLTTILPPEAKQTKLKFKQYETYNSPRRIQIAKKFIEAKIERTGEVLNWLHERYEVNNNIDKEFSRFEKAKTIAEIMSVEGRVAEIYWKELSKIFNEKFNFISRQYTNRPFGAVDPINALLNYGYSLLEGECRRAINSTGLDTHVGFLHEVTIGKEPLVYDLQEPFRWIVDVAVISCLEKEIFDKKDFIRTENYNIRLMPAGAAKLTKEMETWLNKKVFYKSNSYSWSYVIILKTQELAQWLSGKSDLNFCLPKAELRRDDTAELRKKILAFSYSKAKKVGMSSGTLWYLKHNANAGKPFKIYKKVREGLN